MVIPSVRTETSRLGLSDDEAYTAFFRDAEPRLRRALVAAYGNERGREAAAEALAYGWQHWQRVRAMQSPLGYLYRVGQSRTRPRRIVRHRTADPTSGSDYWFEPGLGAALRDLSERQRVVVVLVVGFDWTLREVAEVIGVTVSSVQSHLERALTRLRTSLEVKA